jgi:hypothetical protein
MREPIEPVSDTHHRKERKEEDEPGRALSKREEVRADVEGRQGSVGRLRSARNMVKSGL